MKSMRIRWCGNIQNRGALNTKTCYGMVPRTWKTDKKTTEKFERIYQRRCKNGEKWRK